mmetsp:Transcript_30989/g.98940  ORF Transcript_30989/g.98940 Transcript_30989/m.98940 type:complete len:264 (+) Transcript_30989:312-1103(+)
MRNASMLASLPRMSSMTTMAVAIAAADGSGETASSSSMTMMSDGASGAGPGSMGRAASIGNRPPSPGGVPLVSTPAAGAAGGWTASGARRAGAGATADAPASPAFTGATVTAGGGGAGSDTGTGVASVASGAVGAESSLEALTGAPLAGALSASFDGIALPAGASAEPVIASEATPPIVTGACASPGAPASTEVPPGGSWAGCPCALGSALSAPPARSEAPWSLVGTPTWAPSADGATVGTGSGVLACSAPASDGPPVADMVA